MAMNVKSSDPSLFSATGEQRPTGEIVFLTNRHNLLEILASGVIAPREAYAKYYDDILAQSPGRIPLLRAPVGVEACEMVVAGEETAYPVALELDVRKLSGGPFPALCGAGATARLMDASALAWAPVGAIPLSVVSRVHFRSDPERREYERRHYENVPPLGIPVEVSPRLFDASEALDGSLRQWLVGLAAAHGPDAADYDRVDRLAGAICMIVAAAPARPEVFSGLAVLLSAPAAEPPASKKRGRKGKEKDAPRQGVLPEWLITLWDNSSGGQASLESRLFGSAFRVFSGITRSAGWHPVEALSAIEADVRAGKLTKAEEAEISRTVEHIRAIVRNERDLKPFRPDSGLDVAKAILMVLLRPDPSRLLAWPRQELAATDSVWITAAALGGALSGFKRLSTSIRGGTLHSYVSERAALQLLRGVESAWPAPEATLSAVDVVHEEGRLALRTGDGVLISREQAPPTLTQLVAQLDVTMEAVARRLAEVCRVLDWTDCVTTSVMLSSPEFTVRSERRGAPLSIQVSGWPEVVSRLNGERFKQRLEREGLGAEHDESVRKLLAETLPLM